MARVQNEKSSSARAIDMAPIERLHGPAPPPKRAKSLPDLISKRRQLGGGGHSTRLLVAIVAPIAQWFFSSLAARNMITAAILAQNGLGARSPARLAGALCWPTKVWLRSG